MTIAKFYRITGSSTQHKGVVPDISFPELFSAEDYGESAEKTALPWDKISEANYSKVADLGQAIKFLAGLHDARMKTSEDFIGTCKVQASFMQRFVSFDFVEL